MIDDIHGATHEACRRSLRDVRGSTQRRDRAADSVLHGSRQAATPAASSGRASLWSEIAQLAAEAAAREPLLRPLFDAAGLLHATPARIASRVLSRRLGCGDCKQDATLQTLLLDTLGEEPALLAALEADLVAVVTHDPACPSSLHALLHLKGFHALQIHRVAHSLWTQGRFDAAHWLSSRASVSLGVDIHPAVPIGKGVMLDHATGIVIGETAVVEDGVTIFQGVTLGATGKQRGDRHPKVRRGAVLGAGAKVLGNIEVGQMSKVGAGSVVLRPVPPRCTVAGIPATVVRTCTPQVVECAGARRMPS